ncbi:MAG: hypothetical protein WCR72_05995 [Bacteroidota bacterium]
MSQARYCMKCSQATLLLVLWLTVTLQCTKVLAQSEIPDSLVKVRILCIQQLLEQGKPNARLWWNGWLYGYSAATIGQGAAFFMIDKLKTKQDMALGAATTLIGAAGQLVAPMVPVYAPARLALIPGDTPSERIIKLKRAEELFEASAKREKDGRSWQYQLATTAVNTGSGLITWIGFKRTVWAGLGNFALNTAICEVQIWSQPTRAIKDYKNYRENYEKGLPSSSRGQRPQWYAGAYPGGMAFRLVF